MAVSERRKQGEESSRERSSSSAGEGGGKSTGAKGKGQARARKRSTASGDGAAEDGGGSAAADDAKSSDDNAAAAAPVEEEDATQCVMGSLVILCGVHADVSWHLLGTANRCRYRGIVKRSNAYVAQCKNQSKYVLLGHFATAKEAACAYDLAVVERDGRKYVLPVSLPPPRIGCSPP